MNKLSKYKTYFCRPLTFLVFANYFFAICTFTADFLALPAVASLSSKTRLHRHRQPVVDTSAQSTKSSSSRRRHKRIAKKKLVVQDDPADKEEAAREAEESKFNQSRNSSLARAYQLYDSGSNEALLGNYKYSILQLKLANALLQEHGQENTSLGVASSMELAAQARLAKDYFLARTTYEKLLLIRPQDTEIFLRFARMQADSGNFKGAQFNVNQALNIDPDNAEARLLFDLINNKTKPKAVQAGLKTEKSTDLKK